MVSARDEMAGAPAWVGTPRQFGWLHGIVQALLLLNLFDAMMTLGWIAAGQAYEANPLLAELAHNRPVLFALAKTTLVSLGCVLLWRQRHRPVAVIGIFAGFMVYYLLALYHLHALRLNLSQYLF